MGQAAQAGESPPSRLLDRAQVRRELGVSVATADAIFRELPTVRVPGMRRTWIRREHLDAAIERWTLVDK